MDKPADAATAFGEVYQSFLDDLALEGLKPTTIAPILQAARRGARPAGRRTHTEDRQAVRFRDPGDSAPEGWRSRGSSHMLKS